MTFRPKPRKLAESLFMWAFHSEKLTEHSTALYEEVRRGLNIDYNAFYREYVHFRMFVADWVLEAYERRDGDMHEVRSAFNLLVALMAKHQSRPEETQKELEARLSAYTVAVNKDDHLGPAHAAATTFLELCGDRSRAKDILLVTSMTLEFAALTNAVIRGFVLNVDDR